MSNIKTELQYRIALGILGQMCSAGLVNGSRLNPTGRVAAFLRRRANVSVIIWLWSKISCGTSLTLAQTALYSSSVSLLKSFILTSE